MADTDRVLHLQKFICILSPPFFKFREFQWIYIPWQFITRTLSPESSPPLRYSLFPNTGNFLYLCSLTLDYRSSQHYLFAANLAILIIQTKQVLYRPVARKMAVRTMPQISVYRTPAGSDFRAWRMMMHRPIRAGFGVEWICYEIWSHDEHYPHYAKLSLVSNDCSLIHEINCCSI